MPFILLMEFQQHFHLGHLGMHKCLSGAKDCVYLLNITFEINDNYCSICIEYCNHQPVSPLHDILIELWTKEKTEKFHFYFTFFLPSIVF